MYKAMQTTEKLHRAIQVGQIDEAKRLIDTGANMDHVLGMRGTALCAAIEARSYEMTRCLLEAGCDVNAHDFDGEPPLLLALRKALPMQGSHSSVGAPNRSNILPLIINHPKCNLNKIDPLTRCTALHFAVSEGMNQVVKWLTDAKSEIELNVNTKDADGNTPLHLAVTGNKEDIVKVLVSHKHCLATVNTGDKTFIGYPLNLAGLSALHICARKGNVCFMKLLLQRLAGDKRGSIAMQIDKELKSETEVEKNVNALTQFERESCMHIASRHGHTEMVRLLLDWGSRVDDKDNMNNTPLLLSLVSQSQWHNKTNELPELLLRRGADPNVKATIHNTSYVKFDLEVTPLILSALNNNVKLSKLLVSHGADVNGTDSMGKTALYTALSENALPVALFLVRDCPEINVNLKLRDNSTCLHAIAKSKSKDSDSTVKELVKFIFALGGTIEYNDNNQSPVDLAREYDHSAVTDAILNEAESFIYDTDIETTRSLMSLAIEDGQLDIVKILLSHGVDIDSQTDGHKASEYLLKALNESQFEIAEYLVMNGIDLCQFEETFQLKLAGDNTNLDIKDNSDRETSQVCNIDDDSGAIDTDTDSSVGDSSSNSGLDLSPKWRALLYNICSNPRPLELSCLISIRKCFITQNIPFMKMHDLPIPPKLQNKLRYKNTVND